MERMEKKDLDELYHLLRVASNDSSPLPALIYGMSKHLLAGGDYLKLLQFLEWYGATYLVEPAAKLLREEDCKFGRIVELGAGLGWLGRRLAMQFNNPPTLFVDKRPWTMIDIVADVETNGGVTKVLDALKPDDLVVMSEFVHCLDDPISILENFSKWPKLVIEYCPTNRRYMESYSRQIERFGAKAIELTHLMELADRKEDVTAVDVEPHVILFIPAKKE